MSVEDNSQKTSKSKKTSWVWQYFTEETRKETSNNNNDERNNEDESVGEKMGSYSVMICQVKEKPSSNICGKVYVRKDSSTGNAISHLRSIHNITQAGKVRKEIFNLYYSYIYLYYLTLHFLTLMIVVRRNYISNKRKKI